MFNVPPTPTMLPPAAPAPLVMPNNFGLWESAPSAIGLWNFFGQYTAAFQIIVIALIAFAAAFILMRLISSLNDEENPQRGNTSVGPSYQRTRRRSSRRRRR